MSEIFKLTTNIIDVDFNSYIGCLGTALLK